MAISDYQKASENPYNELYGKAIQKNAEAIRLDYENRVKAAIADQSWRSEKCDKNDPRYKNILDLLFRYTAGGNFDNQEELFFSRYDRFGNSLYTPNVEHSGLTFFSRPKLPLTPGNLAQCPSLAALNTYDPQSRAFAIRCWLDTHFTNQNGVVRPDTTHNEKAAIMHAKEVEECPYFDPMSALLIPLGNACVAQSGWPDPFIQTFTTTGGFFCEDQTYPIGSDRLRKTYDINFTFREGPGSPILALLHTWYEVMASLCEGSMVAYSEDIDAQRMCYTCSIYRFLLDPSKTHITHYAKATGCFPKAPPLGVLFNQSRGEINIQAANEISIPFVCNKVEYDDPRILLDFNFLVTRYCHDIATYPILKAEPYNNFKGYPFVISTSRGLELAFREPNNRAYGDAQAKKLPATTREKFELADLFYGDKIKNKDDKLKLPRGPESRFLYRVNQDAATGDIVYVQSTSDDYTNNIPVIKTVQGTAIGDIRDDTVNTYNGVPLDDTIESQLGGSVGASYRRDVQSKMTRPVEYQIKDADGNIVGPFDPIHVTGTKAGTTDGAARDRANEIIDLGEAGAPLKIQKGNRDIMDAGSNPNPIHNRDRTIKK